MNVKHCEMRHPNKGELCELILNLTNIHNGYTKKKEIIRDVIKVPTEIGFTINYLSKLNSLYERARKRAIAEYPEAFERTVHEKRFEHLIKQLTKKKYVPSVLIGRQIVDGFFPQHRLAIEIDGDIHNKEHKMRKDCRRDENIISKLRIPILAIDNHDLTKGRVLLDVFFKRNRRKSYATEKRLWVRLYANTVIHYFSIEEICSSFGIDFILIFNRLKEEFGDCE